jgi:hypothetical protein
MRTETILDGIKQAKAAIDALPKSYCEAFVTNHHTMQLVSDAVPQAALSLTYGLKIFPLVGVPEDTILAFKTEEDACRFLRKVKLLTTYGCPPAKAVQFVRGMIKEEE